MAKETLAIKRKLRCAVYTRKSSEEGLEQEFNSLDAQREACEAYMASQRAEGWFLLGDRYDDGGFSGGTLERPALKRLIADIESRRVDIVVVYKIDRLSRSLMDFAKLVEVFDRNGVTFVSVTQSFNTTNSMGRLTLNILLSFAQFEREVIGERIRDKFAASRRKGMWMGGWAPLGYDINNRKLVVNEAEAKLVRSIFTRFASGKSGTRLVQSLAKEGALNKQGKPIDNGYLYRVLNNRVYLGETVHKGTAHAGEHRGIIDRTLWDKVHGILKESPRKRASHTRARTPALLKGLIFGPEGVAMTPTHTRKKGALYRYYVATSTIRFGTPGTCPIRRIPASDIEAAVIEQIKALVQSPEIIVATWRAARQQIEGLTERQVQKQLQSFSEVWLELFPAEQARIVQLLVARVDVNNTGADITLRTDGLATLMQDIQPATEAPGGSGMTTTAKRLPSTITVHVPLKFSVRGGRKTILGQVLPLPRIATRKHFDDPIVKAIARAYRWRSLIEGGTYASITELAEAKSVNQSYACRLLRLTLLAPKIIEVALNRRISNLTLDHLMKPVPVRWDMHMASLQIHGRKTQSATLE